MHTRQPTCTHVLNRVVVLQFRSHPKLQAPSFNSAKCKTSFVVPHRLWCESDRVQPPSAPTICAFAGRVCVCGKRCSCARDVSCPRVWAQDADQGISICQEAASRCFASSEPAATPDAVAALCQATTSGTADGPVSVIICSTAAASASSSRRGSPGRGGVSLRAVSALFQVGACAHSPQINVAVPQAG